MFRIVFVVTVVFSSSAFAIRVEDSIQYLQPEFARSLGITEAQVDEEFGATGEIRCPRSRSSGSVVVRRDTVATCAHAFWSLDDCKLKNKVTDCHFRTFVNGKEVVRKLSLIRTGLKCPGIGKYTKTTFELPKPFDDWSVLKLDSPVPREIKPYQVGYVFDLRRGSPLLVISGVTGDLLAPDRGTGEMDLAKSFTLCQFDVLSSKWIHTNCSTAHGSSGGALLNEDGLFVGVTSVGIETNEEEKAALAKPEPVQNSCKYSPSRCFSGFVPAAWDFKFALDLIVPEK